MGNALADVPQSDAVRCRQPGAVDAASVVTDGEHHLVSLLHELDVYLCGTGMFEGIVHKFVGAAVEDYLDVARQSAFGAKMVETGVGD